jgi:hypothetical protein
MTAAVFAKVAIFSEGRGAPPLIGTPRCGVRERYQARTIINPLRPYADSAARCPYQHEHDHEQEFRIDHDHE